MQLTHTLTHINTHTYRHTHTVRQSETGKWTWVGSVLDSFPIVNSHFRAAARGQACGRNEVGGTGAFPGIRHVASGKAASVANNLNAVARYIASHLINYAKNDVDSERCIRKMFATATVSGTTVQPHPLLLSRPHSPLSPAQLATSRTVLCVCLCVATKFECSFGCFLRVSAQDDGTFTFSCINN